MNFQKLFLKLLQNHIKLGYLRNPKVFQVLRDLPLDKFFTEEQLRWFVLGDRPVLFYYEDDNLHRTVSAPHMISMMTSMMELKKKDQVLMLGAKGGYMESVIASIVENLTVIEQHPKIAEHTKTKIESAGIKNITMLTQNPLFGQKDSSEYSKILISGAIPYVPWQIIHNLAVHGFLVFPLIIKNINLQSILQVVKKKDDFEVVDFGSVIFSPLYALDLPEPNPDLDLTLEKLVSYSKINNPEHFGSTFQFFEEFRTLPQLLLRNLKFAKKDTLHLKKPSRYLKTAMKEHPMPKLELKDEYLDSRIEVMKISLYNPEPISIEVDLIYHYSGETSNHTIENITTEPHAEKSVKFPLILPIKPGEYHLNIIAKTKRGYRIGSSQLLVFVELNKDIISFTLELI